MPDSIDGTHHEIAARDQQHGIDGAAELVQLQLRRVEQFDIARAGKCVGQEKNAEYQQFGQYEKPHGEIAREIAAIAMGCRE